MLNSKLTLEIIPGLPDRQAGCSESDFTVSGVASLPGMTGENVDGNKADVIPACLEYEYVDSGLSRQNGIARRQVRKKVV